MVTKRTPARSKQWIPRRKKAWSRDPTLMKDLANIGREVPASEWAKVPTDASSRLDEYLESSDGVQR